MMMPKPVRPPPVIWPSSVWVKPYCSAHCPRMPARIENPTPEARMAMNPAQSRRYALGAARSADFMKDLLTREGGCPWPSQDRDWLRAFEVPAPLVFAPDCDM